MNAGALEHNRKSAFICENLCSSAMHVVVLSGLLCASSIYGKAV